MKPMRNLYIILFGLISVLTQAQIDRTKAPEPGPAPEIKLGQAESFELKNGLKVYVVENHKLPRIAFSLSLDREPILEGDNAGYVSMAGQLLRNGTTTKTKAQLDEEIDFIGASLSTSSTGIFASSLTKHSDKLLELMTDVLYNPSFPQEELDKLKKQTMSSLAQAKEDPNAIAGNVRSARLYGSDHPYGELSTEETVEKITVEDCKAYYNKYFKPNIGYLAIVGDITAKDAKKLVKKYFSSWESGEIERPKYETPQAPAKTYVALVDRPSSVQSVINVTYPIDLKIGAPEVVKARVMNQILGAGFSSRLMQNLREDKAYTYGARSSLSSDRLVGDFIASASVRNEVTDSSVHEFMYELNRIVNEDVTEDELKAAKASIMGSFARSLESPQTVASFAINTARYNLPADYYASYLKRLDAVTIADVREMAKKYIKPENAHIIVVGKGKEVASKLSKFGEVKYYDVYGKEYTPSPEALLPEGLTVQKVIDSYVTALGGKENVGKIRNVTGKFKAEMMGNALDVTRIRTSDFKAKTSINMSGMVVMESITDGEKAKVSQMGQVAPLGEKETEEQILANALFSEMLIADKGAKMKLVGVESIDGKDAYEVEITLPKGGKYSVYFDAASGLKVRYKKMVETPQGNMTQTIDYSDYKEVNGVKFPHMMVQKMGPQNIRMEATSFEINKEIPTNTFSVN